MENYHVLELIGEGSFGRVYKGRRKYSGQVVALKFIPKVGRSEKELKNLRREIEIMRGMHHENIIEMLDSFETEKEVVAVTDYAEGELFQILEDDGSLPEEQVQSIACQLVSALYYLHSHRILHRDMKPQNILLGKGGIVKLCDFGFARAMSINTLVLTSIKGTPLYMSPELVEEKPYDHTADLWALGCILYELYTGQPPFYTNSIFQLVSLIIKDPVRWPKNMTPVFKDFLQGLLTKNPRNRLSWPHLLEHPFVAQGVRDYLKVNEGDKDLASPFTQAPTSSLILERDKQAKQKAHTPGTSKILSKAREKAHKDGKQQQKAPPRTEAWGKEPGEKAPLPEHPERPHTRQWEQTGASQIDPTPRADRISNDYNQEYPNIEIGSRKVLRQEPERKKKKPMENVKLNEEEADSDEEWQGLAEGSDPEADPESAIGLLGDKAFVTRLKSRLNTASAAVLDSTLEGASRMRTVLRLLVNLISVKSEFEVISGFLKTVDCPNHVLTLIDHILQKHNVKEQPWCQQIMIDLVATMHAYFACEISQNGKHENIELYMAASKKFINMIPKLVDQKLDKDLRLREQTLMCLIYLCETMERTETALPLQVFTAIADSRETMEALLMGSVLDHTLLQRVQEVTEGQTEAAQQRVEDLVCLTVASLAALTHIPVAGIAGVEGKRRVGEVLGQLLCEKTLEHVSDDYLLLLNHPATCANILKAMYTSCQSSTQLCAYFAEKRHHLHSLTSILHGKVELADMETNSVIEMALHTLSVIIIQTQEIPAELSDETQFLVGIFLESQLASHTAAAALLFSQLLYHGISVEVQPEQILMAALSEFTDLAQICVRCPFEYGVLDGIVFLLFQLIAQGELPVASMYIESGIWSMLWHRVAQMLRVKNNESAMPIHNIETNTEEGGVPCQPDWALVSFQGLLGVLQLAITVFTKEMFQVIPSLANKDGVILLTLQHLLSKEFLEIVDNRNCSARSDTWNILFSRVDGSLATDLINQIRPEGASIEMKADGSGPMVEIILQTTQLLCFPFAVDTNEDVLSNIQESFQHGLLPRLFYASQVYLKSEQLELPVGLMSRLVLGDPVFVEQFATCVTQPKGEAFIASCMNPSGQSISVVCDTVSICSHLVRTSQQHLAMLQRILQGTKGDYSCLRQLLEHANPVLRSRTCSMVGNMMRHSTNFYVHLRDREGLLDLLLKGLKDEDPNVRKGATYAIGNAAFHSSQLYGKLGPAIPPLIQLLDDPVAKTRANAASALGNLTIHSTDLINRLLKEKVIQHILEVACHDSQYGVQECALTSLRSMVSQPALRKELKLCNALEKLTSMSGANGMTSAAASTPRMRTSMMTSKSLGQRSLTTVMGHCAKLIRVLSTAK